MVKAYVCKAAEWVTREAMQIHGGFGYAEEYTVSRLFVDARVLSIFEGADETLCLKVIARRLTDAGSLWLLARSAGSTERPPHRRPYRRDPRVPRRPSGQSELGEGADALEVGVGVVVVGVEEDRVEAGGGGAADVHRHGVADVGDAGRGRCRGSAARRGRRSPGRAWRRRRRGCRRRTARSTPSPGPTWQTPERRRTRLDLPGGVGHDAERHAGRAEGRGARSGCRRSASATAPPCGCARARRPPPRRRRRRRRASAT